MGEPRTCYHVEHVLPRTWKPVPGQKQQPEALELILTDLKPVYHWLQGKDLKAHVGLGVVTCICNTDTQNPREHDCEFKACLGKKGRLSHRPFYIQKEELVYVFHRSCDEARCLETRALREVGIRKEKPRGSGLTGSLKLPMRCLLPVRSNWKVSGRRPQGLTHFVKCWCCAEWKHCCIFPQRNLFHSLSNFTLGSGVLLHV